jgi:hypothetical protein
VRTGGAPVRVPVVRRPLTFGKLVLTPAADQRRRESRRGPMAKQDLTDPTWPADPTRGEHPVTELASDRQGSLSPFGDLTFPLPEDQVPYVHPVTVINR